MADEHAELSAADLELLGRICDELRGEEAAQDADAEDAGKQAATPDELRREKNRLKVRRHYHRRLRLMSDLRRQVALLETQLRHLQRCVSVSTARCDHQTTRSVPAADWPARLALLADLERVRGQLERENRALRHCVAFHAAGKAPRVEQRLPASLGPPAPGFLVVRPLAESEVRTLRAQLAAQVAGFALGRALSPLGGVRGWEAERGADAGRFELVLRRRCVRGARPEALLQATWALLTRGERFRALFSPRLGVACDLVQPIDADNALALMQYNDRNVHARLRSGGGGDGGRELRLGDARTVKTLFAVAKFSEPKDAHTIVLRAVERHPLVISSRSRHDERADRGPEEEWTQLFAWVRLERTERGAAVAFGGAVPTLDARSPYWLVELFLIVLRWEQAVLGE